MKKKSVLIIIISCVVFSWFLFVVRGIAIQLDIDSKNPKVVGQNIVYIPPVADTTSFSDKPVTVVNMGNMFYRITLDYNCGLSHKEMGGLLGKEIKDNIPNYAMYCDMILKSYMGGPTQYVEEYYISNTKRLIVNIEKDYSDELEGMAAQLCTTNESRVGDNKLSKDEFLVMNFLQELAMPISASTSSIYGNKTTDGKTISGVNFDMNDIPFKALSSITVYKQGDKSFCNIGYAGLMGVNSAFNDDKIFATLIDETLNTVLTAKPGNLHNVKSTPFDLRYALENNTTLDNAIAFMTDKNHKYYRDHSILFSDPETSKVLENDLKIGGDNIKRAVRTADSELNDSATWGISDSIAAVNSFMLKGNNDSLAKYNNALRLESFRKLINDKKSPSGFDDMKTIMSNTHSDVNVRVGNQADGSIYNNKTVQSIIFKPEDMRLEVAFTPPKGELPAKPNFITVPIEFK